MATEELTTLYLDHSWQYDASQAYCLQNQNWSNIPDFTPNQPAPLKDGTATPVREAMTLAVEGVLSNASSTSVMASTMAGASTTASGIMASLTGTLGPSETGPSTTTGAENAALRHLTTTFSWTCLFAVCSGMVLMI